MKTTIRVLVCLFCILAAHPARAITGYYNQSFYTGYNLFQDSFLSDNAALSNIFFPASTPVGTKVSLWNPTLNAFDITSEYLGGSVWTINFSLTPGTGAQLYTPSAFTNTFVGTVVNRDGTILNSESVVEPPPFTGPAGLYLLGDKLPVNSTGDSLFMHVVGRLPQISEQIIRLDATTQTYVTSTSSGDGAWDIIPQLKYGEAAFFNIAAIPEPGFIAIGLMGGILLRKCRSRA